MGYRGINHVPASITAPPAPKKKGMVLNYCQYGVLYLGSYYKTGPYIYIYVYFPHFGNSNLGKLPYQIFPVVYGSL